MIRISPSVQNAALLCTALLVFSSGAAAVDFGSNANAPLTLCDSFGKTWSVTAGACNPTLPLTVCLTGQRDTLNLNACGSTQSVFGDYVLFLGVVSAYTVESAGCSSTFWVGHGTTDITGNVYDSSGLFGAFTLTQGACSTETASATATFKDPARK